MPRATCGAGWSPLTVDKAPEQQSGVTIKDTTEIARVEIAGVDPHFADILRRELSTKAGMVVADAPIGDDLRRLFRLGVVADVAVELDEATLTFRISPRPTIGNVTSYGGDALARARFRQLAETSFEPARLRRMTEAIRESYVGQGRLDAKVDAVQRTGPHGIDVCVTLDPGPRVTVGDIEFPGRNALSKKELVAAIETKHGKPFNQELFERDQLVISAAYWDKGYADVHLKEPQVERRGKHLDITIPVEEGPIYRLGAVTSDHGIAIPLIKRGDLFSRTRIADARQKIEEADKRLYLVLPMTHIDRENRTIDINFELEWRYPWDALRAWLSRSR